MSNVISDNARPYNLLATALLLGLAQQSYAGETCTTSAGANGSTAVGFGALACGTGSTASGYTSTASGFRSTATGDYSTASGYTSTASGTLSIALGAQSTASGENSFASGTNSTASGEGSIATGTESIASGVRSIATGFRSTASHNNSVALGAGSETDRDNSVSVGSAGAERQITNVAAATADTDAVNKGQMDAADAATLTSANTYTNTRTAATLSSANAYTDMKLQSISLDFTNFQNDVSNRFDETDKSINRVGSLSAAMAQMSSAAAGNRNTNRVAVGVGNYNGETSLAVGYQRTVSEKVTITFGGAFGGNENMVGGGASLGW